MFVVLIKLVLLVLQQAPGMEELVWEQYTVTLQKVSCAYFMSQVLGSGTARFKAILIDDKPACFDFVIVINTPSVLHAGTFPWG
jgi:hypothetical protein